MFTVEHQTKEMLLMLFNMVKKGINKSNCAFLTVFFVMAKKKNQT